MARRRTGLRAPIDTAEGSDRCLEGHPRSTVRLRDAIDTIVHHIDRAAVSRLARCRRCPAFGHIGIQDRQGVNDG
jgi:hypothetical protein